MNGPRDGSSTRSRRSYALASSNSATAPSAWIHARAPMNSTRGSWTPSTKSRQCSYAVGCCSGVPLDRRRIRDVELAGHVLHHRPRHVQGVLGQEVAQIPHRRSRVIIRQELNGHSRTTYVPSPRAYRFSSTPKAGEVVPDPFEVLLVVAAAAGGVADQAGSQVAVNGD